MSGGTLFAAEPTPVLVPDYGRVGATSLKWLTTEAANIQIRVGAPDGPLVHSGTSSGQVMTGQWVHEGMTFYLLNVSRTGELQGILATLRVSAVPKRFVEIPTREPVQPGWTTLLGGGC